MREEAAQFMSLYPDVRVEVRGAETREAIVNMLNDSVHAICTDRPLNDEERAVARQAGMRLTENRFAEDALAVVVNAENPVRELSVVSIRRIVAREISEWSGVPEARWQGPIDLVLTGRNSGPPELLQRTFLSLPKPPEITARVATQRDALDYVGTHPGAITFVSMSQLAGAPKNVRVLAVESADTSQGQTFVLPTQMNVYQSLYRFHYSLYLITAESKAAVGTGFSTFVVVTVPGQKAVQNAGLVPVNIPNRVIQLNPE